MRNNKTFHPSGSGGLILERGALLNSTNSKNFLEKFMEVVFIIATTTSIVAVGLICIFIFANGLPAIAEIGVGNFLLGRSWKPTAAEPLFGIFPMIVGSLYVTLGAMVIGVPVGLLTAIFMAQFCPKKIYAPLKACVNLLAGIPSIVYGLFTLTIIVPFVRETFGGQGTSMFTAMILLGVMILPTVIGLSEAALRAVPRSYYEGAVALGATHERAVMAVVTPAAKSGIFASFIMGIGRAIGETMAVVMVAGNQPIMPSGLFEGVRTMTTNIVLEMNYAAGLHRQALVATGSVLFIFILIINLAFQRVKERSE